MKNNVNERRKYKRQLTSNPVSHKRAIVYVTMFELKFAYVIHYRPWFEIRDFPIDIVSSVIRFRCGMQINVSRGSMSNFILSEIIPILFPNLLECLL